MHDAEIIAVGSEMLTPSKIDTNSLYLTGELNALGVEVRRKVVVCDDRTLLTATIAASLASMDIVILTGGLGPTEDDLTRDAVAAALGRGMTFHQDIADSIEQRFKRRGRVMPEINKRQAFVIDGAEVLPNPNGSAPGQFLNEAGKAILLLPGPPNEMKPMFDGECLPRLRKMLPPSVLRTRFFRVTGLTESDLDQRIAPLYIKYTNPTTTILASPGDLQIHLRARCETEQEAEALLREVEAPIIQTLGQHIVSLTGEPIESVIGSMLLERSATLAVAESCTGGMVGEKLTSVAGSSAYFRGGFITYTDDLKRTLLGVPEAMLREYTAASAEVALAMAQGARAKTASTYAVSITGEAGPESSTGIPVGTVFFGFAGPNGSNAIRLTFPGDRTRVRAFAAMAALDFLRRSL